MDNLTPEIWALDPYADREDAILFLPADRIQRNFRTEVIADYSTAGKEFAACLFPLAKVFEPDDWSMGFQEYWDYDREMIKLWNSFNKWSGSSTGTRCRLSS